MKKRTLFYVCKHCGNLVTFIHESGAPLTCCGDLMEQVLPNTVDAATEKHVPVVETVDGQVVVTVGSVEHPMTPEHYIQWIYVETEKGFQIRYLSPEDKPTATFSILDDKVLSVFEYCNLHGLWKTDL
jgi:superoxide reductase